MIPELGLDQVHVHTTSLNDPILAVIPELGLDQVHVHTTSLKDPILAVIPELQTEGMDILIIYDEDIGISLKQACIDDCNSDALILSKAY